MNINEEDYSNDGNYDHEDEYGDGGDDDNDGDSDSVGSGGDQGHNNDDVTTMSYWSHEHY